MIPCDKRYGKYRSFFSPLVSYPPLTLPVLAALVPPELHAELDVYDEFVSRKKPPKGQYDIVAFSFITCSSIRAYELAAEYKRRGAHIVFGGYHTTLMSEEAALHADTIIIGEGEISWPLFLRDFAAGKAKRRYENRDIKPEHFKGALRDLTALRSFPGYAPLGCIMANRGCPKRCAFCAICKINTYCTRKIADVIAELSTIKKKLIVFFDPNFFADRNYALALMAALEPLKKHWMTTVTVNDALDDELMAEAGNSGCIGLIMGIESLNGASLNSVNKGKTVQDVPALCKKAVDTMHRYGINVNGSFVLGLDNSTEEELLDLPRQVEKLELDLALFFILTPAPGTELFTTLEEKGRILSHDWSEYTQDRAIFKPQNMSPKRLEEIYATVWKETYTIKRIWKRALRGGKLLGGALKFAGNLGFKFLGKNN
jgi:radical SAM superfamily enzyme YgiQ (UPF0313 family)